MLPAATFATSVPGHRERDADGEDHPVQAEERFAFSSARSSSQCARSRLPGQPAPVVVLIAAGQDLDRLDRVVRHIHSRMVSVRRPRRQLCRVLTGSCRPDAACTEPDAAGRLVACSHSPSADQERTGLAGRAWHRRDPPSAGGLVRWRRRRTAPRSRCPCTPSPRAVPARLRCSGCCGSFRRWC